MSFDTQTGDGATALIARFCASYDLGSENPAMVARAQDLILDLLAVTIAAAGDEVAELLAALPLSPGKATVVGRGPASEADAAFVNAALSHALEFDDSTLNPVGHPSATILPALLALAETDGLSGAALIEAYLVGLEVHSRLGQVEAGRWNANGSWLPIGHVGVIGAAVGCGKLLGLDASGMEHAIGLAAQFCGGLAVNSGTHAKPLGAGNAARSGLLAARLAKAGAASAAGVIEAKSGFADTFLPGTHDYGFLSKLGAPSHLEEVGIAIKRYPSCYATHWGNDALLMLVEENGFGVEDVETITLAHPKAGAFCDNPDPRTPEEARFSHEYNLAVSLLDGVPGVSSFEPERIDRADVRALLRRVSTRNHPDDLPSPASWEYRVFVALKDGRVLSKAVPRPLGHPRNPMSSSDISAKFERCVAPMLAPRDVHALRDAVLSLRIAPSLDGLTAILRSVGTGRGHVRTAAPRR